MYFTLFSATIDVDQSDVMLHMKLRVDRIKVFKNIDHLEEENYKFTEHCSQ